jgi:hypothetical protein
MTYTKTQGKTLNLNQKHRSDGSELIPAEVQANILRHDDAQSIDASSPNGYTVDDEGLINNYAIEPGMYPSDYPSPPQQRQYVFQAVGASLFIVILVSIALIVS